MQRSHPLKDPKMSHLDITFAKDTIHNPKDPRHFMAIDPIGKTVRVYFNGTLLAETTEAVRLKEVGGRLYDPVVYLPRDAVRPTLAKSSKQSHCPLKGDCAWYSLEEAGGADIAWSYETPFDFADKIANLIAFDAGRVVLEEIPA